MDPNPHQDASLFDPVSDGGERNRVPQRSPANGSDAAYRDASTAGHRQRHPRATDRIATGIGWSLGLEQ